MALHLPLLVQDEVLFGMTYTGHRLAVIVLWVYVFNYQIVSGNIVAL